MCYETPFFPEYPHIMYLTEHHLKDYEIDNLPIDHYKLGSKFCRQEFKNGGGVCVCVCVCVYLHS
jgi:hypothetical protein